MSEERITAVSLSRGPCYGPCPVYRVTLSKVGHSAYIGESHTDRVGPHHGRLDPDRFDGLVGAILRLGFTDLRPWYQPESTCGPTHDLVLWSGAHGQRVIDDGTAPPEFSAAAELVDAAAEEVDWQRGRGRKPYADDQWRAWERAHPPVHDEPLFGDDLTPYDDITLAPTPRPDRKVRTRAWGLPSDRYGSQHLEASILASGDLMIEGQDLGQGLPIHGLSGVTEYEYGWTIRASDIDALISALGGQPGDDVLTLLLDRFPDQPGGELAPFFEAHAIPAPFWSRFTD